MLTLEPSDPAYPSPLLRLPHPRAVTLSGPLPLGPAVAIVGTRKPIPEARAFAESLAREIARAGGTVVSGGALGIDAAAHEGALAEGGATVCVVGTGRNHVFPPQHVDLYRRIQASSGAMVWPFPDDAAARSAHFLRRNGLLVALARALVVVQAGGGSGALNAASWARKLGKPIWVVPQAPWAFRGFEGSLGELQRGARPLITTAKLLESVDLSPRGTLPLLFRTGLESPLPTPRAPSPEVLFPELSRLLGVLDTKPRHRDELAESLGMSVAELSSALLTLTLENVVEEGPLGFFSRIGK